MKINFIKINIAIILLTIGSLIFGAQHNLYLEPEIYNYMLIILLFKDCYDLELKGDED